MVLQYRSLTRVAAQRTQRHASSVVVENAEEESEVSVTQRESSHSQSAWHGKTCDGVQVCNKKWAEGFKCVCMYADTCLCFLYIICFFNISACSTSVCASWLSSALDLISYACACVCVCVCAAVLCILHLPERFFQQVLCPQNFPLFTVISTLSSNTEPTKAPTTCRTHSQYFEPSPFFHSWLCRSRDKHSVPMANPNNAL